MAPIEITSSAFKGEFHQNMSPARLVLTSTGETPTCEDQARLCQFLTQVVQAQVEFAAVYDLRVMGMPSPSLVRSLGEWCKENEKEFQRLNSAIAIIIKNNFWSGAVKKLIGVVTAISPPVCPLLITYSSESAESFILENCSTAVAEMAERIPSRFPSIESCDVAHEEDPSQPHAPWRMPEFVLAKQAFPFSAKTIACSTTLGTSPVEDRIMKPTEDGSKHGKSNPMERDDCSTFADSSCSLSVLDFSESSIDVNSIRRCFSVYSGSEAHCLTHFRNYDDAAPEGTPRSSLAKPKNRIGCFPNRVRKFVTKSR
jgi:hypothetical protein